MRFNCLKLAMLAVILMLANAATAAPGKILYTFQGASEGQDPTSALVLDAAGNLYGMALSNSNGVTCCIVVYELSPSPKGGWNYQVLYQFAGTGGGSDTALLLDKAGNLYGTVFDTGTYGAGFVFELTPSDGDVWSESTLYNFGAFPNDGTDPQSTLIFDESGNLYGTTTGGGTSRQGTVFELVPNGTGGWTESILYSFVGRPSDGSFPLGSLTFDAAGNLYGTTNQGGNGDVQQCFIDEFDGCGTVFELAPQGANWVETLLHNFQGTDGQWPGSGVVFDSKGNLYGTTRAGSGGGSCERGGCGTAFVLVPGQGGIWTETTIANFRGTNGNGYIPSSGLIFDSVGNLYGTTGYGGAFNYGIVYRLRPKQGGSFGETVLYSFTGGKDGAIPGPMVFDSEGNLFGTTFVGGSAPGFAGYGVVFAGKP
jgi:uncharacterized repeat protein (TIGR03803 family)